MVKKIIAVAAALLVAYLIIVGVPKWIEKEKRAESQRNSEMEDRAQQRAGAATSPRLTGGRAGFGGDYTERAMDNATNALNRSDQEVDENEQEPETAPDSGE